MIISTSFATEFYIHAFEKKGRLYGFEGVTASPRKDLDRGRPGERILLGYSLQIFGVVVFTYLLGLNVLVFLALCP